MTTFEALKAVRAAFPTEQAMAAAFGVSQPTVWRWLNVSKCLPPKQVLKAERLTGVSRHDLDPVCYPRNYPPAPDARLLGVDQRARMRA